jgi:hypothetical protein
MLIEPEITQIIMVAYHRPRDFKRSIHSVFENTICPFRITIIDNSTGGLDRELSAIEKDERITIYRNSKNIGKGAAFNQWSPKVLEGSSCDHFISIDADVQVPQGWLLELKRAYREVKKHQQPGIIAPAIKNHEDNTFDKQLKSNCLDMHVISDFKKTEYYDGLYYNKYVAGPLFLISIDFFKSVGGYYDKQLYGTDDGKLCAAARRTNRFVGIDSNVEILHLNEDSTEEYNQWKIAINAIKFLEIDTIIGFNFNTNFKNYNIETIEEKWAAVLLINENNINQWPLNKSLKKVLMVSNYDYKNFNKNDLFNIYNNKSFNLSIMAIKNKIKYDEENDSFFIKLKNFLNNVNILNKYNEEKINIINNNKGPCIRNKLMDLLWTQWL